MKRPDVKTLEVDIISLVAMTQLLEKPQGMPEDRRFSRDDYYRMGEFGLFLDDRVELIDGRVILMPPQGNCHDVAVTLTHTLLLRLLGDEYWVRVQMSLDLAPMSAPEPDIAVVRGLAANSLAKPRTALLVVEVSETTLNYDRTIKQRLYASNNIADYWIVNLTDWHLEVYRNAIPDTFEQYTHRFSDTQIFNLSETATPLALPGTSISVAKLFPAVRHAK